MLPCKDIVKILSSDEKVSFLRRAELRMHLMMCEHCSAYSRHLKSMRKGFKSLFARLTNVTPESVSQLEEHVIKTIKKTPNGS